MTERVQRCATLWLRRTAVAVVLLAAAVAGVSFYYRTPPYAVPDVVARIVAAPVLGRVNATDVRTADRLRSAYWVGDAPLRFKDGPASWRAIEGQVHGFRVTDASGAAPLPPPSPFVYESADAPYLQEVVTTHGLRQVVGGAASEYDAMLRMGAWVGGLFDHGTDVVGDRRDRVAPSDVIDAGRRGRKFWCEVAARLTVQVATALGWQARLVTASTDGYTWNHAVAEVWSNQYRKWFVIDADFNVVYEAQGIPQSAFELCHRGPDLQRAGHLAARRIAPSKPSLPLIDLVPYYAYVHIDLRNDWYSRRLRPGSPVGGDWATWWTARPTLGPVLTAKTRVDRADVFDWTVNAVSIHALERLDGGAHGQLRVGLVAYSPAFRSFEIAVDSGPWADAPGGRALIPLSAGRHAIKARVVTRSGQPGPEYVLGYELMR